MPAFASKNGDLDFLLFRDFHRDDLPNKDVLDLGIKLWKEAWSFKPANQRPTTLALNEYG